MAFSGSQSAPIKLEGFDIPGTHSQSSTGNPGYIDPSVLFSQYGSLKSPSTPFGGGGFSALDLGDFDSTFADLMPPSSSSSSSFGQANNHAGYGAHDGTGGQGTGGGGFNLPAFEAFGYSRPPPSAGMGVGAGMGGADFAAAFAAQQHAHQQAMQQHQAHPPSSALPLYLSSSSAAARSPIPAFASSSPRDSRSPSAQTDLFGQPIVSTPNIDSPNDFGSYSSVGESLSSAHNNAEPRPSASSASAAAAPGTSASSSKRRTTSTERSRSTGKAPNSSSRSRSARRVSTSGTAAYQSLGAASPNGTSSQPSQQQQNHGASAIIIPSSNQPQSPGHQQQHAMSMPVSSNWFASAQAIAFAHSTKSPDGTQDHMDPTGWKPSNQQSGPGLVPSSAPVAGSKKVSTKPLDDVLEDPSQKQAALLTEKRRKRRESHNAVERRRRDNINDRITELASLLPECLLDGVNGNDDIPGSPGTPHTGILSPQPGSIPLPGLGTSPATASNMASAAQGGKPNKGIILAKSVEYIRFLQQLVELHTHRNSELERMVSDLRSGGGNGSSGETSQTDSADQSPDARIMAMVGSSFSDPLFNEKYLNAAATGMFNGANGGSANRAHRWGELNLKEEENDDELMRD